jgi:hypothetical protein
MDLENLKRHGCSEDKGGSRKSAGQIQEIENNELPNAANRPDG